MSQAQLNHIAPRHMRLALQVTALLLGVVLLGLTIQLFAPLFSAPKPSAKFSPQLVPSYPLQNWRALPIQDGRTKPFETECAELVRQLTGRERFEKQDPVAIVLAWWLGDPASPTSPVNWEQYPFLLCDHHALRRTIFQPELAADAANAASLVAGKYVSPADLRSSPGFDELLVAVALKRSEFQGKAHLYLTAEQLKAEEVAKRLALYDAICGRTLTRLQRNAIVDQKFLDVVDLAAAKELAPDDALRDFEKTIVTSPDPLRVVGLGAARDSGWFSFSELKLLERQPTAWRAFLQKRNAEFPFPDDELFDALEAVGELRKAYQSSDPQLFATAETNFYELLKKLNGEPSASQKTAISRELLFNRLQPFRGAWLLMLLAGVCLLVSLGTSPKRERGNVLPPSLAIRASVSFIRVRNIWLWAGLSCYVFSLLMQTVGFGLRVAIAGRAPVANMYETVVFVAFLSAIFALVLEGIYRRRVIALAGSLVATLGLILADQLPLALDPKISPMVPVLRTNFWLTVHVLTIVASYAGGTLAWGLGNITLGCLAFGRADRETLKTLSLFTYRAMQIAVLLLAAGTFLGGCWAAESWGRFWGWDPKEVGALVALICYVIPLHARYIGWVQDFGLAVSAVLCYASIILSWYVINFLLAAGLHSYGFSSGGATGVLWATVLNLEWVVLTALRFQTRRSSTVS